MANPINATFTGVQSPAINQTVDAYWIHCGVIMLVSIVGVYYVNQILSSMHDGCTEPLLTWVNFNPNMYN